MTIAVVLPPFPSPTLEFMPFPDKTLSQTGVPRLQSSPRPSIDGIDHAALGSLPLPRPGSETLGAPGAPFPPPSGTHSSTGRRRPRGQRAAGPGTCWSLCGPSVPGWGNEKPGVWGGRRQAVGFSALRPCLVSWPRPRGFLSLPPGGSLQGLGDPGDGDSPPGGGGGVPCYAREVSVHRTL